MAEPSVHVRPPVWLVLSSCVLGPCEGISAERRWIRLPLFHSESCVFSSPPCCFSPPVRRAGRGARSPHCVCVSRRSLRALDARADACVPLLPAASTALCSSAPSLLHVLPGKTLSTCLSRSCSILCSVSNLGSFDPELPDAFSVVVLLSLKASQSVCHLVGVALLTAILSALFSPECSCESGNHEFFSWRQAGAS